MLDTGINDRQDDGDLEFDDSPVDVHPGEVPYFKTFPNKSRL